MLGWLFVAEALVDLAFGIALIAAPAALLSIYGITTDQAGEFLGRFLGGTLVGFGLLSWQARGWADTDERRLLIRVLFVTTVLGLLAAAIYQVQPGVPIGAAVFVVLTLLFALAWGYFAWKTFPKTEE